MPSRFRFVAHVTGFPAVIRTHFRPHIAPLLCFVIAAHLGHAAETDTSRPSTYVTFFPPVPPVYSAPIREVPSASVRFQGQPLITPEDLADFVGEIFYPMLGTRTFERSQGKYSAQLDAYRSSRSLLLNELEDELRRVQEWDAATRERALQEFCRQQLPRVSAHEEEAERLRRELIRGGFWGISVEWNLSRDWRLGDAPLAHPPHRLEAEYHVARAAAFFQDGLAVDQRGLLLELAFDLRRAARTARRRPPLADDNPKAMFFSPETARFQLPDRLPPELVTKIGWFNREKSTLKQELLETLNAVDRASDGKREKAFAALAEKQSPRLSALEEQAEEIRRELAAAGDPPPPWVPPIPLGLQQRIESYARDRSQIVREFDAVLAQARGTLFRPGDFNLPPATRERLQRERSQAQEEARRAAAAAFERENAERIAALYQRYDLIRTNLGELARDLKDPRSGQPLTVETLLLAYHVANQRFDAIGREEVMYRNYKIAMLQPGLSPAHRRLLFIAAHAGLAQPLPLGEVTPLPSSRPRPP